MKILRNLMRGNVEFFTLFGRLLVQLFLVKRNIVNLIILSISTVSITACQSPQSETQKNFQSIQVFRPNSGSNYIFTNR